MTKTRTRTDHRDQKLLVTGPGLVPGQDLKPVLVPVLKLSLVECQVNISSFKGCARSIEESIMFLLEVEQGA